MQRGKRYAFITILLLAGALLRLGTLSDNPPGFNRDEIIGLRLAEAARDGHIAVFYPVDPEGGREGIFYLFQAFNQFFIGDGLFTSRVPGFFLGMLTAALIHTMARRLYGDVAALAALAAYAVGFWPALSSRAISYLNLTPPLVAAAVWMLAKAFTIRAQPEPPAQSSHWRGWAFVALGVLIGLSFYAHWSAGLVLSLLAVLVIFYVMVMRPPGLLRPRTLNVLFAVVSAAVIALPFMLTWLRDPSISSFNYYLGQEERTLESEIDALYYVVQAILWHGDISAVNNYAARPILSPESVILFIIGLGIVLGRPQSPAHALTLIGTVCGLIPALLARQGTSFSVLISMTPFIYAAVGVGADGLLSGFSKQPSRKISRPVLLIALIVIAVLAVWTGLDLWVNWPASVPRDMYNAHLAELARTVERRLDAAPGAITFCSYDLGRSTLTHPDDAWVLEAMLHPDIPVRAFDCRNGMVIAEGGGRQWLLLARPTYPGLMTPPVAEWFGMAKSVAGAPDGTFYELAVAPTLEDRVGALLTTSPAGYPPDGPSGGGPAQLPVPLDGNLSFLGYEVPTDEYKPGDIVRVITYWRADAEPEWDQDFDPGDMRLFAHILPDPAARPIAQSDLLSTQISTLHVRDIFIQVSDIVLPSTLAAGSYDISVGLYNTASDERLTFYDSGGPRGDRLFLQQITINRDEG